jgi:hypothetical protein
VWGRSEQHGEGREVAHYRFHRAPWRNRFIAEGVVGLGDEPRPVAPREIGDEKIEDSERSYALVQPHAGG